MWEPAEAFRRYFAESWPTIRQLANEALTLAAFLGAAWLSQFMIGAMEHVPPVGHEAPVSRWLDTQFLVTLFEKAVFVAYLMRMVVTWGISSMFDVMGVWAERQAEAARRRRPRVEEETDDRH